MPLPIAAAGIALAPSIFKGISGLFQSNRAKKLRESAIDPGYQMNTSIIDNARILGDRYVNYVMPGYTQALNNINQTYSDAYSGGVQGATSSGDILDLASRIAYGQTGAQNQLSFQNASGRDSALQEYLGANAGAGQQYVNKNEYDRQRYQQQLAEAASLYNAGQQNIGSAINDVANIGTTLAFNGIGGGSSSKLPSQASFSSYQFPTTGPLADPRYSNPAVYNYNGFSLSGY